MTHVQTHAYRVEQPDVEVLVDGTWHLGALREWRQHGDLTWWASVRWSPGPDRHASLDAFPADRVRPA
ncbi:hypothetical protein [Nocardioides sp. GXQ0305]|uniref:hypothetical protein n=1 Tax=Nocardioides sp. GXQ0305 TaxID=3423912 RepID=UPI003D7E9922